MVSAPATPYGWSVQVASGAAIAAVPTSRFVTGLAPNLPWNAAFPIWHPNSTAGFVQMRRVAHIAMEHTSTGAVSLCVCFRDSKSSVTGKSSQNAKLLSSYKLWLNGKLVGTGPGRVGTCGPVCPIQGQEARMGVHARARLRRI